MSTPLHGQAKEGLPARTYIQHLCADTGYSLENLPGARDEGDEDVFSLHLHCMSTSIVLFDADETDCEQRSWIL